MKSLRVTAVMGCPRNHQYKLRRESTVAPHFDVVKGNLSHYVIEKALKCESLPDYEEVLKANRVEPDSYFANQLLGSLTIQFENIEEWLGKTEVDLSEDMILGIEREVRMPIQEDYELVGHIDLLTKTHLIDFKCFDTETEILTIDGFKKYNEVKYADEIATLNRKTGFLEYQHPIVIYNYDYNGDMVHFKGRFMDLLITPTHSVYTKMPYEEEFRLELAENCIRYGLRFTGLAKWKGNKQKEFELPIPGYDGRRTPRIVVDKIEMKDFLTFFGAYLSEGYTNQKNYRIRICNDDYEWKKYIGDILEKYGYKPYIDDRSLQFHSKQLALFLKRFGQSKEKYIPTWMKNLDFRYLKVLFNNMWKGDGSKGRIKAYSTSSKQLADDFQEICLKLGYHTSCKRYFYEGLKNPFYRVALYKSDTIGIGQARLPQREHYQGLVWCVEVPNHLIYVRRNGLSCWTGNSGHLSYNKRYKMQLGVYRELAKYEGLHDSMLRGDWVLMNVFLGDDKPIEYVSDVDEVEKLLPEYYDELFKLIEYDKKIRANPKYQAPCSRSILCIYCKYINNPCRGV